MKTQIENTLNLTDSSSRGVLIADEFNFILEGCLSAKTESDLRAWFETTTLRYFSYGFGSSHFWMCQKDTTKRILFIEF